MNKPMFYIASVLIMTKGYNCPVYFVTTNCGVSCYVGYDNLPQMVKDWLDVHNNSDYTLIVVSERKYHVLLISDVKVVQYG